MCAQMGCVWVVLVTYDPYRAAIEGLSSMGVGHSFPGLQHHHDAGATTQRITSRPHLCVYGTLCTVV